MTRNELHNLLLKQVGSLRRALRHLATQDCDIDDLCQEAICIVLEEYEQRGKLPSKHLGEWLYGVARHLRSRETRRNDPLTGKWYRVFETETNPDVKDVLLAESVNKALSTLDPNHRRAVEAMYGLDWSSAETARKINVTVAMIHGWLRHSKVHLRLRLDQCHQEYGSTVRR